jgi:hypothetical protein
VQRIFIKKFFLFTVRSVSLRKAVHNWPADISLLTEVETKVQKWLRQQSKDIYATGCSALVKQ